MWLGWNDSNSWSNCPNINISNYGLVNSLAPIKFCFVDLVWFVLVFGQFNYSKKYLIYSFKCDWFFFEQFIIKFNRIWLRGLK